MWHKSEIILERPVDDGLIVARDRKEQRRKGQREYDGSVEGRGVAASTREHVVRGSEKNGVVISGTTQQGNRNKFHPEHIFLRNQFSSLRYEGKGRKIESHRPLYLFIIFSSFPMVNKWFKKGLLHQKTNKMNDWSRKCGPRRIVLIHQQFLIYPPQNPEYSSRLISPVSVSDALPAHQIPRRTGVEDLLPWNPSLYSTLGYSYLCDCTCDRPGRGCPSSSYCNIHRCTALIGHRCRPGKGEITVREGEGVLPSSGAWVRIPFQQTRG